MADLSVNFMHPTDGSVITVTVDDTMNSQELVGELLANNFMPSHPQGYQLSVVETGTILRADQTLADAKVKAGSKVKVLPITEAGV